VQGTASSPPNSLQLEALGFHPLIDIAAMGLPAGTQSIAVRRDWLNSHHDIAQRYMDSMVQAVAKVKADRPASIALLKKYFKSDDQKAMDAAYDFLVKEALASLPAPKPEQFKDAVDILAKTNPKVASFNVTAVLDDSFVKNAADRHLDRAPT